MRPEAKDRAKIGAPAIWGFGEYFALPDSNSGAFVMEFTSTSFRTSNEIRLSRLDVTIKALTAVALTALTILASGCGHDEGAKSPPPVPCATGVNQNTCAVEIMGPSKWILNYDVTSEPNQKVVRKITVITEFNRVDAKNIFWRRTTSIVPVNPTVPTTGSLPTIQTTQTMIVEGRVLSVTPEKIDLKAERSSCDGVDNGFWIDTGLNADGSRTLYYQRSGASVSFRTTPFPKVVPVNGGDPISNAVASGIATMMGAIFQTVFEGMTDMTVQMLTLGRARNDAKEGAGQFTAADMPALVASGFTLGEVGCFAKSTRESAFVPNPSFK